MTDFQISRLSDVDLSRMGLQQMINMIRHLDKDRTKLLHELKDIKVELNNQMVVHMNEIRNLRDSNQRLHDENLEMKDLCVFLDDDRQKGRKLAREWQKFGQYTSNVMKKEVIEYQQKLTLLESRQESIVSENLELKELCILLDEQHLDLTISARDQGDGSSCTPTDTEEKLEDVAFIHSGSEFSGYSNNDHIYLQSEHTYTHSNIKTEPCLKEIHSSNNNPSTVVHPMGSNAIHARKVLEVHDLINQPLPPDIVSGSGTNDTDLSETEKAIVREMCNVVWRKLGTYSNSFTKI